ncbi:thiamine phosphate synthase [Chelativorans sp. ZYF759]|uniref:thiamine phosphate synthase n=1 Tax=Chelativorans sp. ZYF759 TaxID=2692213 RepID=UPI00145CC2B6|nr:thiamine phosphate synthase [Chelativorans sp. ZYF759]NMG41969.1 thiamine phosphate synthase [Chelativorans sp. ZYF759]
MPARDPQSRCRLVLVAPEMEDMSEQARLVGDALSGGDVATVIVIARDADDRLAQARVAAIIDLAHAREVAVIVVGDTRIAARAGADGVHLEGANAATAAETVEAHGPRLMVGVDGAKTRHDALELGEARPDYIFFGRFGYDTAPASHPRNLALGEWWSQMVAIPCIVQGGADIDSVREVAASGAEFVALSSAVFGGSQTPGEAVRAANALLDDASQEAAGAA